VADGCLREQDKVTTVLLGGDEIFTVQELGLLSPSPLRTKALFAGQVAFTSLGGRNPQLERIWAGKDCSLYAHAPY
jgi:translation elongation factor EF-4